MTRFIELGLAVLLLITLLPAAVSAAESAWDFDVGLRMRYDDNIGFAPDAESKRDDLSTRVSGTVGWTPVNKARHTLNLTLTPFYEGVKDLEDLSNYGAILGGSYRHQFNEDFTAPWVSVLLEGTLLEFEDSEIRDGYKIDTEVVLGKNFSPKFGASIGYRYQYREATNDFPEGSIANGRSDEVFDHQRDGPFVKLDFTPAPRTTLFAEYAYLQGDVTSTADPSTFLNGAQFPRARDFAFEEGTRFVAWRIPAKQNVFSLGLTQAISERFSLEVSATYQDATSSSGNDYDNWFMLGELRFSF